MLAKYPSTCVDIVRRKGVWYLAYILPTAKATHGWSAQALAPCVARVRRGAGATSGLIGCADPRREAQGPRSASLPWRAPSLPLWVKVRISRSIAQSRIFMISRSIS